MLMDFLIVSLCIFFLLYWRTFRVVMTYILFFGIRTIIQVKFYLPLTFNRKTSI
jgi:hypothetical protein